MKKFQPYDEYEVGDYYGVSLTKLKKNGYYSIVLVYDYDRRALKSNSLIVPTADKALRIYEILDMYAKDKKDQFGIDDIDLFGSTENESDDGIDEWAKLERRDT